MSKKVCAVIGICMCVFFIAYGLLTGVLGIIRSGWDGLLDLFIIVVLCGVTCLILSVSFNGAFKKRSKRSTKGMHKKEKTEQKDEVKKKRDLLYGLAVLGGLLVFAGLAYGFGIAMLVNMNRGQYVETVAEIVIKDGEALYSYTANGTKMLSSESWNFFGVYIKAGNTVKISYDIFDPKNIKTATSPVMLLMAGTFVTSIGGLAFCSYTNRTAFMPFWASLGFLSFGIFPTVAIALAFGFNFFELMTSGVSVYALTIFTVFGLYFFTNVIYTLIKRIFIKQ